MKKIPFIIIGLLLVTQLLSAQQAANRYKDVVFKSVTINKDLSYADETDKEDSKSHLFDLYQPTDDAATDRPLIIWMHGGGFKFGSKDDKGIQLWSKDFAKRGYVCAAINYRLSKKNIIFQFGAVQQDSYYAVQDAREAIAFFRKNHAKFHIDPDKIILAGNSAGGMISLLTGYSSNAELARQVGLADSAVKDPAGRIKIAAVVNFWGGIYNLDWLKNAKIPIVSVYGDKDNIVVPDHKNSSLYGSVAVHREANQLGIPNRLKIFKGYSHELQRHFNPFFSGGKSTEARWLQAAQFASDFLYDKLFR